MTFRCKDRYFFAENNNVKLKMLVKMVNSKTKLYFLGVCVKCVNFAVKRMNVL